MTEFGQLTKIDLFNFLIFDFDSTLNQMDVTNPLARLKDYVKGLTCK